MKALLEITRGPRANAYLLFFDESLACLSPGERPIDVVMEIFTQFLSPKEASQITRGFEEVSTAGLSHVRAALAPGCLRLLKLAPGFRPQVDHNLLVMLRSDGEDFFPGSVSLDGLPPMGFTSSDLKLAPERSGHPDAPLFQSVLDRGDDLHIDQSATGALIAGYLDACLAPMTFYPPSVFTAMRSQAVCVAAAAAGQAFARFKDRCDFDWASHAARRQYANFIANGYIVSERGWNPCRISRGPRLAEALEEGDPALCRFGRMMAKVISPYNDDLLACVVSEICDRHGHAFEIGTGESVKLPKDNHSRLTVDGALAAIYAHISAHPLTIGKRTST